MIFILSSKYAADYFQYNGAIESLNVGDSQVLFLDILCSNK